MARRSELLLLLLGAACAPAPAPRGQAPVASAAPARPASPPSATASAPAPSAPAPAAEPSLRALEVDDEPELDEERRKLVALAASAPYVVRGRVRQSAQKTEWRGGQEVGYTFAIVDVLEWLHGDPKGVFPAYKKSFPLFTSGIPVRVNKMPSSEYRSAPEELLGEVGKERIFFLHLPSESHSGYMNELPPAHILSRYGKYSVSVSEHLPAEQKPAVLQALEDLKQRREWIAANAARIKVRDRFAPGAGATENTTALAVRDFVRAELAERAGMKVEFSAPKQAEYPDLSTFAFSREGRPEDTLSVSVSRGSARLRAFRLQGPLVLELSKRHAQAKDNDLVRQAEKSLLLRFEGGKIFRDVSKAFRGDGAMLFDLTLHSGTVGARPARANRRAVDVTMSGDPPLIVAYVNDWAR